MYNGRVKTLVLRAAFVAIPFMIVACDYGMSIRQVNPPDRVTRGSATTNAQIIVNVETAESLIGNISYLTGVKLTNVSSASITVFKIDLLAKNKTYENEPSRFTVYPLTIQPGGTERVPAYFHLDDDVWNTFQKPADLRVYYRIGNEQRVAHASIIGEEKGLKQLFHRD
jgi:hypothetical protein